MVRIRPLNDREIAEGHPPLCVNTSKTITVDTPTPGASSHTSTTATGKRLTRTFTFDHVFGPESIQADIFTAVEPLILDVLNGFNCTIFAYGQTGTGKTHTMEGPATTDPTAPTTGLIPRALQRLFAGLDGADSTVTVSHIELYNEELQDLIVPKKLHIFDRGGSNGVTIQGMQNPTVHTATDVLRILEQSSKRRCIAETQLNRQSSRSHSIFTVNVSVKEQTPEGEDLVKIGKLNLVDLAGSECIARSGVTNMHAKEAGLINQSLLTLGRVINALSPPRNGHVPYRQSKLTRILQDSLGGRAKTCMIATISPSHGCCDLTLSTLDYASRAKSIQNRPTINKKLSQRQLLRENQLEIERLKSELQATQEKNGIFLPPDQYHELQASTKAHQDRLTTMERAHQETRQQLDQSQADLQSARLETQNVRTALAESGEALSAMQDQHAAVIAEKEQITHSAKELARELIEKHKQFKETVEDLTGTNCRLFARIDRAQALEDSNVRSVRVFRESVHGDIARLQTRSADFAEQHRALLDALSADVSSFAEEQGAALSAARAAMERHEAACSEARETLRAAMQACLVKCRDTHTAQTEDAQRGLDAVQESLDAQRTGVLTPLEAICGQLAEHEEALVAWRDRVRQASESALGIVDALAGDLARSLEERRATQRRDESQWVGKCCADVEAIAERLAEQRAEHTAQLVAHVQELLQEQARAERAQLQERVDALKTQLSARPGECDARDEPFRESAQSMLAALRPRVQGALDPSVLPVPLLPLGCNADIPTARGALEGVQGLVRDVEGATSVRDRVAALRASLGTHAEQGLRTLTQVQDTLDRAPALPVLANGPAEQGVLHASQALKAHHDATRAKAGESSASLQLHREDLAATCVRLAEHADVFFSRGFQRYQPTGSTPMRPAMQAPPGLLSSPLATHVFIPGGRDDDDAREGVNDTDKDTDTEQARVSLEAGSDAAEGASTTGGPLDVADVLEMT